MRMSPRRGDAPAKVLARVRAICAKLPDAREEVAWAGTRWTIRKKNFAHVVHIEDGWPPAYAKAAESDGPLDVLTFRVDAGLDDVLRTAGGAFFRPVWGTQWGTKVAAVRLGARTDWKELAMLITESYRLLAPKRLR
jgi:hypothetical protein